MIHRPALLAALVACAAMVASPPLTPLASQIAQRVSEPFRYAGYSSPDWKGYSRSSVFVTMRDGTKIAVHVVLPTEYAGAGRPASRFPVIFRYTPYGRSAIDLKTGKVAVDPFFLSYGYALASADMRGTGASFGWMNLMD